MSTVNYVLFADSFAFEDISSSKSVIWIEENKGPRINP